MKYLLSMLFLVGCIESKPRPVINHNREKKYCIQACMEHTFKWFHNKGSSWGTGSSSMNGLSQTQVFDRVKKECVEFYKDEKCAEWNFRNLDKSNIIRTHGFHGPKVD